MAKEFTISIHDAELLQRQKALADAVCTAAEVYGRHIGAETPSTLLGYLNQAVAHSLLWEDERVKWLTEKDSLAWEVEYAFSSDDLIVGTLKIDDDDLAEEWERAFPNWNENLYATYMSAPVPGENA